MDSGFIGLEALKEQHAEQVAAFERWAAMGDWYAFHENHYDWWAYPVNRRDHRHRQLAPLHRDLLRAVGIAVRAYGEVRFVRVRRAGEIRQVEPGAERAPFA